MRKRLLVGGLISVTVITSALLILVFLSSTNKEASEFKPITREQPPATVVENIETESIDDINVQYSDTTQRYIVFMSSAKANEGMGKFDEAIEYYKAASLIAPSAEAKQEADIGVYTSAKAGNIEPTKQEYEQIVGEILNNRSEVDTEDVQ